MYTAYANIKNQREISTMDQKLIDLLDDNLRTILEFINTIYINILITFIQELLRKKENQQQEI